MGKSSRGVGEAQAHMTKLAYLFEDKGLEAHPDKKIRSVIEEFAMQIMGGMMAAKTLLERALLPSLLPGCCNWTGITKKTEDNCDDLILMYWRVMMKVPESTPKIGLIAELQL